MAVVNTPMFFSIVMALFVVGFGAIYEVGDSNGWTNNGFNYESWSSTKNFTVGDFLRFKYDRKENDVVRVFHRNFWSCNPNHQISKKRTGDDCIHLYRPGNFFFISSVNGHCQSGQKLHVSVSKSLPSSTPGQAPFQSPVSPTHSPRVSSTSPTAAQKAAPTAAPKAPPTASPRASPTASPKDSSPAPASKLSPSATPKVSPAASPKASAASKVSPIAAPRVSPNPAPAEHGSSIADSPPDSPMELVPAPEVAPASPPKKNIAPSMHPSVSVLIALGIITYIFV